MYVCEPVLRMIEPVQCLWTCVMYMSHCYVYEHCYVCEPVLWIWNNAIFVKKCYVYEPVLSSWTSVMYMSHCYVCEPVLCLWASAMFVNQCYVWAIAMYMRQCYVCEPVLCMSHCYVYEPVLCLWTSVMYEPLLCIWASAMFVNPCFSCEPGLHLPLMMTVWFSKCLAASQAVFRHWETQLNHLVPSKEENQEISCTAKSFPESDREKNKMSKFFEKGNFFRRILGLKSFGHTGYMSTFEILE